METIPAGRSTVAFPMDYRLRVEAWVADQPLILSGELDAGKVIIDGGYSRFYCDQRSEVTDVLWNAILSMDAYNRGYDPTLKLGLLADNSDSELVN